LKKKKTKSKKKLFSCSYLGVKCWVLGDACATGTISRVPSTMIPPAKFEISRISDKETSYYIDFDDFEFSPRVSEKTFRKEWTEHKLKEKLSEVFDET